MPVGLLLLAACVLHELVVVQPPPDLQSRTTSVLFDVVVRDSRGRPVRGLTLQDFSLTEDGTPQQLTALFTRPSRVAGPLHSPSGDTVDSEARPDTAAPAAGPLSGAALPAHEASATAFVFDQLSPEGRALALRVAQRLASRMRDDEWLGVFGLDASLVVAQGFSRDREATSEAVSRMLGRPLRTTDSSAWASTTTGGVSLDPTVPATAGAESAGGLPTFEARRRYMEDGGPAEKLMAQIEWRMALAYDDMARDLQGQNSVIGLRAVSAALAQAPGRKSLVLFAEGLPVTERNRPHFEALIATANSAGVSFYVIDAAGLRVHSAIAEGVRQQDVAGRTALGDLRRGRGAWTLDLERQADVVRSDGNAALWRLARETGGVLIENTNSVDAMAQRLNEDQDAHYLLAYSPLKSQLDATYRHVRVTVRTRGLTAVHRSGYWAVP